MKINSFDIDGVIYINDDIGGIYPGPHDFIITGRSFEEEPETRRMLEARGIKNSICFNPLPFDQKTRKSSGEHKARCLNNLLDMGHDIQVHFDDDEIQADVIRRECPRIKVVMIVHDLTEKENVRHNETLHRVPELK